MCFCEIFKHNTDITFFCDTTVTSVALMLAVLVCPLPPTGNTLSERLEGWSALCPGCSIDTVGNNGNAHKCQIQLERQPREEKSVDQRYQTQLDLTRLQRVSIKRYTKSREIGYIATVEI